MLGAMTSRSNPIGSNCNKFREILFAHVELAPGGPARARVNAMRHVLNKFDYDGKDHELAGEPDPLIVGRALAD